MSLEPNPFERLAQLMESINSIAEEGSDAAEDGDLTPDDQNDLAAKLMRRAKELVDFTTSSDEETTWPNKP